MKTIKASSVIKEGKLNIGYISTAVQDMLAGQEVTEVVVPTYWTLTKRTTDKAILADKRTAECSWSDLHAFLKNPPEGSKDGNWNLFYIKDTDRVVSVRWRSDDREWGVLDWSREDVWYAGRRVFSPATGSRASASSLETLPSVLVINGVEYKRV